MMKVTVNNIYNNIYYKSYSTQNRSLTVFKEHTTVKLLEQEKR